MTLNYRLGALGFLVSSSDGLFGNFGLMDQRAALHWIQDNIEHFGEAGAVLKPGIIYTESVAEARTQAALGLKEAKMPSLVGMPLATVLRTSPVQWAAGQIGPVGDLLAPPTCVADGSEFSRILEFGLPGMDMIPTAHRSILHATRPSQLQYPGRIWAASTPQ